MEVPEDIVRFRVWDLKNRKRIIGLEPGCGLSTRDIDLQVGTKGYVKPTDGTSLT